MSLFRFFAKQTIVKERVRDTKEARVDTNMPFVDLTICPEYHTAYKSNVFKEYGLDKENYRIKGNYIGNEVSKHHDLRSMFNSLTYDVNEILERMVIYTSKREQYKF